MVEGQWQADPERHPNEQPGARLDQDQQALVSAALQDLASWCESHAELVGGFEAGGIGSVVEEIRRRIEHPHVGVHLSAVLRG